VKLAYEFVKHGVMFTKNNLACVLWRGARLSLVLDRKPKNCSSFSRPLP